MVACSSCGGENPLGSRFCNRCGGRLAAQCTSCGAANVPDAAFCNQCGAQLGGGPDATAAPIAASVAGASPTAAAAERRLVSILFADLVGFTTLSEGRDPEETRELLSRYFEVAREIVERYAGTVEKFIGDAVMAVWGTPTAQEDDAERAVRAALDLVAAVEQLGPGIAARAGVLTGEAAVTLGAKGQGMVAGDPVNTASRLQSAAAPGSVLVAESTMHAASRAIAFEAAGEHVLKGKAAPVPAWRAVRVVAERGGRGRTETLEAPFVGRDEELRLLKDLLHATSREGRARLVSVIGPGGIGKTRLSWELNKYVDGLAESVWWHVGRSPAYGEGISFWALGEMVRRRCGLAETDDEPTTRAAVAATVAEHVADETERRWIGGALLTLLGVGAATTAPAELFGAWRAFFERLADTGTVALVFEDFNYADAGLIDFVDHLLEWSRNRPIYVVTLARPDLLERRTDWHAKRNFTAVTLEPLPDAAMRQLLDGLVPGLPAAAADAIVARADGDSAVRGGDRAHAAGGGPPQARGGPVRPRGRPCRARDPGHARRPSSPRGWTACRPTSVRWSTMPRSWARASRRRSHRRLRRGGARARGPYPLAGPKGDPGTGRCALARAPRAHVRPGPDPRGRLPPAGPSGSQGEAPRRRPLLRVARLGRAGGCGGQPLSRGTARCRRRSGGRRARRPRAGRTGLGRRARDDARVAGAGGTVLRAGCEPGGRAGGAGTPARAGGERVALGGPPRQRDQQVARGRRCLPRARGPAGDCAGPLPARSSPEHGHSERGGHGRPLDRGRGIRGPAGHRGWRGAADGGSASGSGGGGLRPLVRARGHRPAGRRTAGSP